MKLTFSAQDSIYKIFKILKKIPRGKQVDIFLDDHQLLADPRRCETFIKHIRELDITITMTTKNEAIHSQLISHGIQSTCTGTNSWYSRTIGAIIKYVTKGSPRINPTEYIKSKLALVSEILVLVLIVYLFWGTISPKATLEIIATTHVQPISYAFLVYPENTTPEMYPQPLGFSWYTGTITTSISKTIDLQSFSLDIASARGRVRFYNIHPDEISLIGGTTLVTNTGIPYTIDSRLRIPGGTVDNPGTAEVDITAEPSFPDGTPLGEEGNISRTTQLWIEKLPLSIDEKKLRAYPVQDITNGQTILSGTVVSSDIQRLESQLLRDIENQLAGLIRTGIRNNNHIHLPLREQTQIIIDRFVTNAQPGETASFIQGTMDVTILYPYIRRNDIERKSLVYLEERATDTIRKGGISLERIDFYEYRDIGNGMYIVPTMIQTFGKYDFAQDPYDLQTQIKQQVAGRTKEEAISAALLFDEINEINIRISPFWYSTIPQSSENISLVIKE